LSIISELVILSLVGCSMSLFITNVAIYKEERGRCCLRHASIARRIKRKAPFSAQ